MSIEAEKQELWGGERRSLWGEVGVGSERVVPASFWAVYGAIAITAMYGLATGWSETGTMVLLLVLAAPIGLLAASMPDAIDARWLPNLLVAGLVAKMAASGARYWALEVLYNGVGDATGYHNHGRLLAPVWRSFDIPPFELGTEFVQAATGFLYIPYVPTALGGFFIYAFLALIGQVLLYAALRRSRPSPRLKWYGGLIFLFPNIVYWPSSIGKEALMLLFIGIAVYGVARLFEQLEAKWIWVVALGGLGCAAIRSHIALLLAVSLTAVAIVSPSPPGARARWQRLLLVAVIAIGMIGTARFAMDDFGIDLSAGISEDLIDEELDPIFSGVEEQTDRGGSSVEGSAIRSPADVPDAVLRVVFRPLPYDAHNVQSLASSILEGTLLLGLFLWRTPAIVRNLRTNWRSPLVLFSLVYAAGFVFGHSAVLNLGIIARQRSQLMPFVLILLIELGARREPQPTPVAPSAFEARPPSLTVAEAGTEAL